MRRPPAALLSALAERLGTPVSVEGPVAGGDISAAFRLHAGGRDLFCKARLDAPAGFFAAEAAGLRWLAASDTLTVPDVLLVHQNGLVLPWIDVGPPTPASDEALGRGLAALHRSLEGDYARRHLDDVFLARLPQDNAPVSGGEWPTFYRERRLLPVTRAAAADLGPDLVHRIEGVAASLEDRLGDPEPPARLHGDLWGGNHLITTDGTPVLIDPAAGPGHREVDLAMMRLFGGFSERVFASYAEAWPLQAGWRERVPLYQLLYLVLHVALFGRGWTGRVRSVLEEIG